MTRDCILYVAEDEGIVRRDCGIWGGKERMKIEIEIPKEFECDYNNNKFEYFFMRVLAGTDWD